MRADAFVVGDPLDFLKTAFWDTPIRNDSLISEFSAIVGRNMDRICVAASGSERLCDLRDSNVITIF